MKQITQDIFYDAPDWVQSAAVNENGNAYLYECCADDLLCEIIYGRWEVSVLGDSFLFAGKCDATNWQNSAIERKGYRCTDCGYFHVPHQCRECECINCHSLIA